MPGPDGETPDDGEEEEELEGDEGHPPRPTLVVVRVGHAGVGALGQDDVELVVAGAVIDYIAAQVDFPEIDYQDAYYFAAPKNTEKPKSLDEVDPELLRR